MAVSIKYTNDVTALVSISVSEADYQPLVDKALKNYRQKADIPGFRRGHAPMGMIQKKFGLGAKIEEINRFVGQALYQYIEEQKLRVLGEPLPSQEAKPQDLEKDKDFTFDFDLALAPKVSVALSKDDKLPYYHIEASDEMITAHIEQMLSSHGRQEQVNTVEGRDIVRGLLVELEGDLPKDGGVRVEGALLMPDYVKNEEEKAKFLGATKHSVITFCPYLAYDGNVYELSSFLNVSKEQVELYKDARFSYEIESISRHIPAELNEEFYTAAFGEEGDVHTEEELRAKVREGYREQFDPESDYKLLRDARQLLLDKAGKLEFADDLLKRWLKQSNDKLTDEQIDEQYPKMIEDLTYQLIKDQILSSKNVKIEEQDLINFAIIVAKSQFAQYGMMSVPDEALHSYAKSMVEKEETRRNLVDRVLDSRLAAIIKDEVTLEGQSVTPEEFGKLLNPEQAQ